MGLLWEAPAPGSLSIGFCSGTKGNQNFHWQLDKHADWMPANLYLFSHDLHTTLSAVHTIFLEVRKTGKKTSYLQLLSYELFGLLIPS